VTQFLTIKEVEGTVAHDAADAGTKPVKIGGKANAALPSAVGEGDRVDASFDLQGQQRVTGTVAVSGVGGSVDVSDRAARDLGRVDIADPLPAGANIIGKVDVNAALPAGTNNIGKVDVATLPGDDADLDSGGGADNHSVVAIGLPKSGGHVVGGTSSDPIRTDPTGTTTQPVSVGNPVDVSDRSGRTLGNVVVSASLPTGSAVIGKVRLRNPGDTADLGDASSPVRTDPTGTTSQPVTGTLAVSSISGALPAGDNNIGNVDLASPLPAGDNNIGNVDLASPLPAGDNNIGNVDLASPIPAGDNNIGNVDLASPIPAGSNTIGKATALGDIAHDAVDSGNPIKVGAKAAGLGASPTAVAASDRTHLHATRHGIAYVIGGHPNVERLAAKYTSAQTNTVLRTVAAGKSFVVTGYSVFVDKACTVNVSALLEFDAATDVVIAEHPGVAAGSGFVEGGGSGILAIGGSGEDVLITVSVPSGGSIAVHVTGYEEDI